MEGKEGMSSIGRRVVVSTPMHRTAVSLLPDPFVRAAGASAGYICAFHGRGHSRALRCAAARAGVPFAHNHTFSASRAVHHRIDAELQVKSLPKMAAQLNDDLLREAAAHDTYCPTPD